MEIAGIKSPQMKTDNKLSVDIDKSKESFASKTYEPSGYDGKYTPEMFGILPNFKLAETLMPKPTSFKGAVLKKSDFKGSDLVVIERYKPNIQQFKSKDDLQTFAEDKIRTIMLKPELSKDIATLKQVQGDDLKDFGGRQEETKVQRKAMLKEWFDYVIKENDAYSNTQRLIILSAITKDLKSNNDNIPDVLNKGVLAQTVTDLEERLKVNPKDNFDFHKMYKNNLRVSIMEDSSTGETMTGWVVIPSKINDPENFDKNVEKLKTLSHNSWCTKSFNAKPYLSQGDFHVYLENGQPKLGVRFVGDEVEEIQGEKNNGQIPIKYLETFKIHQNELNLKLSNSAKKEIKKTETRILKIQKEKQKLGTAIELKTIDDAIKIFDYIGIKAQKNGAGLTISNYHARGELELTMGKLDLSDLGIDENKLFEYVTEIKGNATFWGTSVTNLGQIQRIGGNVDFDGSSITNLGQLQYIKGNADFENSQIKNLGQLQHIGGCAYFKNSQIKNLGQVKYIGGDAHFENSQVIDLGKLENIGGEADIRTSKLKKSDFANIKVTDGINSDEKDNETILYKITNLFNKWFS